MTQFVHGGPPRFAHQRRGLQKLIQTGGVAGLLFDPGTGKSAVVVDFSCLLALKLPGGEARVLIVAPLAAVDTWVTQFRTFASPQVSWWAEVLGGSMLEKCEALAARGGDPYRKPKVPPERRRKRVRPHHPRALHHQLSEAWEAGGYEREPAISSSEGPDALVGRPRVVVEIINIDALQRRDELGSRNMADQFVDAIRRFSPDFVVVDEAHKIKSASANASRLLARVTKYTKRRAILTGTVMPHSPLDIFGQWRFLDPYAFGTVDENGTRKQATLGEFQARYAVMGGFFGRVAKKFDRLDEMQEIMGRNAAVARKLECLDLPPTTNVEVSFTLSPAERRAYASMKSSMQAQLASGTLAEVSDVLTLGMRLRQLTAGFIKPDKQSPIETVGRGKLNVIKSIIQDDLSDERRIVVFTLFQYEMEELRKALVEKDTEIMSISGGTSVEERVRMRRRFGTAVEELPSRIIMLAQVQAMSVAVNELVTANHAVYCSLSLMRDDIVQSQARLDRIGQKNPVTFWFPLAKDSVDEVIWDSHQKRTDMENAMLRHIADD